MMLNFIDKREFIGYNVKEVRAYLTAVILTVQKWERLKMGALPV